MPGPEILQVDKSVSFIDQVNADAGPVVLVNMFYVPAQSAQAALQCYERDAAFMKTQPGFISSQMHRGIGGSSVFVNYAIWESAAALKAARLKPEFRELVDRFPEGVTAMPVLLQKIAIPNVCVA